MPRQSDTIDPGTNRLSEELLQVALDAARAAVELAHTNRPATLDVTSKSTSTDLVTQVDRATEEAIRSVISAARPGDTVVGEEDGTVAGRSGVTWWVDPIDGTTNYVYDHPGWAVSIGASVDGTPAVGVVADPTHGRVHHARAGHGASCDGRPLRVPEHPPPLERMLVATGFGYDAGRRALQGKVVAELLPQVRDIRRMGAASLDLCAVAAGRVDAYYEVGLSPWDLAAGLLVASEAGARTGSLDGGAARPDSVLVAHPERFDELLAVLTALGAATM